MLKDPIAVDGKGEKQNGSGFQLRAEKGYRFVCVDVSHSDGCFRAKHSKLKITLIGKKILENSAIFVYWMTV